MVPVMPVGRSPSSRIPSSSRFFVPNPYWILKFISVCSSTFGGKVPPELFKSTAQNLGLWVVFKSCHAIHNLDKEKFWIFYSLTGAFWKAEGTPPPGSVQPSILLGYSQQLFPSTPDVLYCIWTFDGGGWLSIYKIYSTSTIFAVGGGFPTSLK